MDHKQVVARRAAVAREVVPPLLSQVGLKQAVVLQAVAVRQAAVARSRPLVVVVAAVLRQVAATGLRAPHYKGRRACKELRAVAKQEVV